MGLLFAFWFLSPCPQGYAASDFKVVLKAGGGSGEDITLIYEDGVQNIWDIWMGTHAEKKE